MGGIWRLETYEMELGISAQVWYKGRILDALSVDVGGVCGLESKEVNGTKVEVMDIERERERELLGLQQDYVLTSYILSWKELP